MENNNMREDLANLLNKYGGNAATLAKELKKINGTDGSKRAALETNLDKTISGYGTISLARFKKEAAKAWHRAFPAGLEKREVKGYQLFVKENMPKVKTDNPDKTHVERMAIIGQMWQDTKGAPPPLMEVDPPTPETEPEPRMTRPKRTRKL
jgi:hypothetical protein